MKKYVFRYESPYKSKGTYLYLESHAQALIWKEGITNAKIFNLKEANKAIKFWKGLRLTDLHEIK